MTKTLTAILAVLISTATGAEARPEPAFDRHGISGTYNYGTVVATPRNARAKIKHKVQKFAQRRSVPRAASKVRVAGIATQILPHPTGCPSRAFCGCGAALDVFGKHIRELWLAANWFKFPRAAAAPGMVAVRKHHVYVIRKVLSKGVVLAYDANSGGHKTRLHARSLAGYIVVNPRGSKYAAM